VLKVQLLVCSVLAAVLLGAVCGAVLHLVTRLSLEIGVHVEWQTVFVLTQPCSASYRLGTIGLTHCCSVRT
jgi:hypothetical protein